MPIIFFVIPPHSQSFGFHIFRSILSLAFSFNAANALPLNSLRIPILGLPRRCFPSILALNLLINWNQILGTAGNQNCPFSLFEYRITTKFCVWVSIVFLWFLASRIRSAILVLLFNHGDKVHSIRVPLNRFCRLCSTAHWLSTWFSVLCSVYTILHL